MEDVEVGVLHAYDTDVLAALKRYQSLLKKQKAMIDELYDLREFLKEHI
jgi:hypothetical protein